MSIAAAKARLDARIEAAEAQLSRLRALRDALEDEDTAAELLEVFGQAGNGASAARSPRAEKTQLQTVIDHLQAAGNYWQTAPQIIEATGLSRASMSTVLYKAGRDIFECRDDPQGSRVKQWRIKADTKTA